MGTCWIYEGGGGGGGGGDKELFQKTHTEMDLIQLFSTSRLLKEKKRKIEREKNKNKRLL